MYYYYHEASSILFYLVESLSSRRDTLYILKICFKNQYGSKMHLSVGMVSWCHARIAELISTSLSALPSLLQLPFTGSYKRDWQLFNEGMCTFDY